jgi:hypothetical protein
MDAAALAARARALEAEVAARLRELDDGAGNEATMHELDGLLAESAAVATALAEAHVVPQPEGMSAPERSRPASPTSEELEAELDLYLSEADGPSVAPRDREALPQGAVPRRFDTVRTLAASHWCQADPPARTVWSCAQTRALPLLALPTARPAQLPLQWTTLPAGALADDIFLRHAVPPPPAAFGTVAHAAHRHRALLSASHAATDSLSLSLCACGHQTHQPSRLMRHRRLSHICRWHPLTACACTIHLPRHVRQRRQRGGGRRASRWSTLPPAGTASCTGPS